MALNAEKRTVLRYCAGVVVLAALYGNLQAPFLLRFVDALSVLSGLLAVWGFIIFLWKDGIFSFFTWRSSGSSYTTYRERLRRERGAQPNPALPAGLIMLAIAVILTVIYVLMY
ncbi:MAG: hypothetical protein IJH44_09710 [Solobacterium sp.]|nr:hypothetical protein [Solobacterium sp.]